MLDGLDFLCGLAMSASPYSQPTCPHWIDAFAGLVQRASWKFSLGAGKDFPPWAGTTPRP